MFPGLAAAYATAPNWEACDWTSIVTCYKHLERQIDSPVITINASVARAFAGLPAEALKALVALNDKDALRHYAPYHIARAEILRLLGRDAEAAGFFELAMSSGASAPVIEHLKERLATSL